MKGPRWGGAHFVRYQKNVFNDFLNGRISEINGRLFEIFNQSAQQLSSFSTFSQTINQTTKQIHCVGRI